MAVMSAILEYIIAFACPHKLPEGGLTMVGKQTSSFCSEMRCAVLCCAVLCCAVLCGAF